jgi:pyruvate dehydrogenase E1 component
MSRKDLMVERADDLDILRELEKKLLWLATWTIHNANKVRENVDGLKVGGHQASSASLATIMTALYFHVLRPEDRVAVKPHASPVFHGVQYLLGRQTREKLENFRGLNGAQSYPSRTKDGEEVDFSTGSVGLGVAQTLFSSVTQDYIRAHGWGLGLPEGRMIALVGDAELDEGNIYEALVEGRKQHVRNCWWIVDYNRQSLDAITAEGLWKQHKSVFEAFGWDVKILKYGSRLEEAFKEPGGERLRAWIDNCDNHHFSKLVFQGGAAWRRQLLDDIGDQGPVTRLIEARSDEHLEELMTNLAGHDLPHLIKAFSEADHERPTCFICYTIKGHGLSFAGHKDNHGGFLPTAQIERLRERMGIRPGHEWDKFEGLAVPAEQIQAFLDRVPITARRRRRLDAPRIEVRTHIAVPTQRDMSTQMGFGLLLKELGNQQSTLADRIVTVSPDVAVSTNLGNWINARGVYARDARADTFKDVKSTIDWAMAPQGQHIELGIAEMNLFILLSALGLSHSLHGERLLPIGTLYDPFIARGHDALNYACYQDARFIVAGTPSGITLAPEGGAHQSIGIPLTALAQDGLVAFEPAYVDELAVVLAWALEYIQRDSDANPSDHDGLRDEAGGAVYLRLSTKSFGQIPRDMTPELRQSIVDGAYWMREPGPNCEVAIAYTGAVAPEASSALGLIAEDRRDVGLLAVTSANRLYAGWTGAQRARARGLVHRRSHIERLFAGLPRHCGIVSVIDGHPLTLGWLGSVYGHRVMSLGVEHFGQSGTIPDLYRLHGIDVGAIVAAAQAIGPERPIRHLSWVA